MRSKKDFVKEFELLVQQEIINHNREILQSNQMMNSILARVEECENAQKRIIRDLSQRQNDLETELKELKKQIVRLSNGQKAEEIRLSQRHDAQVDCMANMQQQLMELDADIRQSFICHNKEEKRIAEIQEHLLEQEKSALYNLDRLKKQFDKQLEAVEKSFLDLPCKSQEQINHHERSIARMSDSINAICTEMKNHKEKRFYNEKQIEHIFNLMDRMEKRIDR